jgi:D-glycero-D-manno-heptose 1,7-bisphosphate phosphatase
MRPAVFLDRDGTLIEEARDLDRLDLLAFFPWTVDAVRLMNRAGFAVVVTTNQSAVGRGLIDEAFLATVHARIDEQLEAGGARIDRYYYCPHHPTAPIERYRQVCRCRKPAPGMIEDASRDLKLDLARSFTVGDRWRDIQAGQAAGVRTVMVKTGYGAVDAPNPPDGVRVDAILNNLMEAVGWMLRAATSR